MVWESYRVGYVNRINTPPNATVFCSLRPSDSAYGLITPTHLAVQNGRGKDRVSVVIDGINYECGQYSNVAYPIFDGFEAMITNGDNPDVEIFLLDAKHADAYLARYTSFPAPIDPEIVDDGVWCVNPLNFELDLFYGKGGVSNITNGAGAAIESATSPIPTRPNLYGGSQNYMRQDTVAGTSSGHRFSTFGDGYLFGFGAWLSVGRAGGAHSTNYRNMVMVMQTSNRPVGFFARRVAADYGDDAVLVCGALDAANDSPALANATAANTDTGWRWCVCEIDLRFLRAVFYVDGIQVYQSQMDVPQFPARIISGHKASSSPTSQRHGVFDLRVFSRFNASAIQPPTDFYIY